jgi:hypothetical protein
MIFVMIKCGVLFEVRTSKKTQSLSATKNSWLTLLREKIAVYPDNNKHALRAEYRDADVTVGGTYSYHCCFKK